MSYLRKYVYKVIVKESFKVRCHCAKCGRKMLFVNTKCFRVNANGNKLDVWLIYRCEKCKHTLNLSVYERKNRTQIKDEEYQLFLCNDAVLADLYGKRKDFFTKNKAEVEWREVICDYVDEKVAHIQVRTDSFQAGDFICIQHDMHFCKEKMVADILQCSRSKVKQLIKDNKISVQSHKCQVNLVIYDA